MPGSDKCELHDQQHNRGYWAEDKSDDRGEEQTRSPNNSSDNGPSNKSCFVATAVYGDINAPEVQVLRDFRDDVLRRSALGRKAIDFYYSGAGERTARFIEKHTPSVLPLIKRGLDYLVQVHKS